MIAALELIAIMVIPSAVAFGIATYVRRNTERAFKEYLNEK